MLQVRMSLSCEKVVSMSTKEVQNQIVMPHGTCVKALKAYLQGLLGKPRFVQRLLHGHTMLKDDFELHIPIELELLVLDYWPELDEAATDDVLQAVAEDDVSRLEDFLQKPLHPDIVDVANGYTALCWAAWSGSSGSAKLLLEARADPDRAAEDGAAPLHSASFQGHAEIVEHLIQAKANLDQADGHGNSALHYAASQGCLDVVDLLAAAGADVDRPDANAGTPMHAAAKSGEAKIVRRLLEAGADKSLVDNDGALPVLLASWVCSRKLQSLYQETGLQKDFATTTAIVNNDAETALAYFLANLRYPDEDWINCIRNLLMSTIDYGDVMKLLVEPGLVEKIKSDLNQWSMEEEWTG
mmetsp:Transcript_6378/g.11660  ORF Transcript_6378/g.11660 Transcript_6378/m.11660 type:complete len:356 (+) Transcript_6378:81-1148(+)